MAREQLIFGCHVHIGISDRKIAIQVMNHARPWLSVLLALSSNSPFWAGTDTGYASYRTPHWGRWPQSGLPQIFASSTEYTALIKALTTTKSIKDPTKLYWDM